MTYYCLIDNTTGNILEEPDTVDNYTPTELQSVQTTTDVAIFYNWVLFRWNGNSFNLNNNQGDVYELPSQMLLVRDMTKRGGASVLLTNNEVHTVMQFPAVGLPACQVNLNLYDFNNHSSYNGCEIEVWGDLKFQSTNPDTKDLRFIVDYEFYKSGEGLAGSTASTAPTETIDLDGLTIGRPYSYKLGVISGNAGQDGLGIKVTRDSDNDLYDGGLSLFNLYFRKA